MGWRRHGRVPHAILLAGRQGLGKQTLARALAELVLCEQETDDRQACGHCRACHLSVVGTHPDMRILAPAEAGKGIRIEQVRELAEWSTLRSGRGAFKVALIVPAEAMNRSAANALLKTLEEPSDGTVMILVSHAPALLPATIRSRCQRLELRTPRAEDVLPWLAARLVSGRDPAALLERAAGAPLRALALGEAAAGEGGALDVYGEVADSLAELLRGDVDVVQAAERWGRLGAAEVGVLLYRLTAQLLRARAVEGSRSTALPAGMAALVERLDTRLCFNVLDGCLAVTRQLESRSNLNPQLLLEELAAAVRACSSN